MLALPFKRIALVAAPIALAAALFGLPEPAEATQSPAWSAQVMGPARGQLEPCGCSGGQLGGIDRAATVLAMGAPTGTAAGPRLAAGGVVALESVGYESWGSAQVQTLWMAFSALQFDAVGFGSSELEHLANIKGLSLMLAQTALVCSNLEIDGQQPLPGAPSDHWSGMGVTMLSFLPAGLSGEFLAEGSGVNDRPADLRKWRSSTPEAALEKLAAKGAWAKQNPTLAFFEGSRTQAEALAEQLSPDSVVMLVGDEYEATSQMPTDSKVIEVGSRLRQVLRISGGMGVAINDRLRQTRVSEDVPADDSIGFLRGLYRSILAGAQVRESVADSLPAPGRGGYVGAEACASCHTDAYAIWKETMHNHAIDTLELDQRDGVAASQDPRCIKCHTVGFGEIGGFGSAKIPAAVRWTDRSPVGSVSCESCHGPGGDHIRTQQKADIDLGGEYTCLECHDSENDPYFNFQERWENISHPTPK